MRITCPILGILYRVPFLQGPDPSMLANRSVNTSWNALFRPHAPTGQTLVSPQT